MEDEYINTYISHTISSDQDALVQLALLPRRLRRAEELRRLKTIHDVAQGWILTLQPSSCQDIPLLHLR